MKLPAVDPALLAEIGAGLPARLRRRLEQDPEMATAWTWSAEGETISVAAPPDATVTILAPKGAVRSWEQLACTCLLAPRCLHVAASVMHLPIAAASDENVPPEPASAQGETVVLTNQQRDAAAQAWIAGGTLLDVGATAAGLIVQGELLRAAHSCRVASLHRAGSAALRVVRQLRDLQAGAPQFQLSALAADLHDLMTTAWRLGASSSTPIALADIGTARRDYHPIGSLRLTGLFTEPVISASGAAGVVTYLCDQTGRIWSIGDVAPGGPERAAAAYDGSAGIGDVSISHRLLARSGLHLQRATGSTDGRLGSGRDVGAVRAGGAAWFEEPLAALWRDPLAAQLDRAWAASVAAPLERPAGSDLLFLRATVLGVRGNALILAADAGGDQRPIALAALAPSGHAELRFHQNLRLLGSAPGLDLLIVARVLPGQPHAVALLAIGLPRSMSADTLDTRLILPASWEGRVNLGLDALQASYLPGSTPRPVLAPVDVDTGSPIDPLDPLRRRLQQVVLGGRSTLGEVAWPDVMRDERGLRTRQFPTGAALLGALRDAALWRGPAADPWSSPAARFSRTWVAATVYESAARLELQQLAWGPRD